MDTPLQPVVVAEYGGVAVVERGPIVLVVDRGGGPSELTVAGLAMASVSCAVFGCAALWSALAGGWALRSVLLAAMILAVGVGAFAVMVRCGNSIRRRQACPLREVRPVATFDRQRRVFLDEFGEVVAPLDQVSFVCRRRFLSAVLTVVTASGTRILKRGSLFSGGVGPLDEILTELVHGARR
ncbi:hypothetical protein ACAG25_07545 [Mycobacterium sp. pV006]|uniref:hypothetical protein n=1 Tax=Mycobacterium sp. pV006 TaxID=3238983 RepID=UPI00351AEEE4